MGKENPRFIKIRWTPELSYVIGLITSDGNLSNDGRHITFTSKDFELVSLYKTYLGIENVIGQKRRGTEPKKSYYFVQFGSVYFYRFLLSIGLMQAKSKRLRSLKVPKEYYFHFLRGLFDGDGTFYSYKDKRWRSSYMFYMAFASASKPFIDWLRETLRLYLGIHGHISKDPRRITYLLRYAKRESLLLLRKMYYPGHIPSLSRKRLKIERALATLEIRL